MALKPNQYEPASPSVDHRKWKDRFVDWVRSPFPTRVGEEPQFRWIIDSFVALALWLAGTLVGGVFAELTPFLKELAYPVGLIVGWFPMGMWMHYCRVSDGNAWSSVLLIAGLLTWFAISNGLRGLLLWSLGCGVLLVVLPLELALGKVVFGRLLLSYAGIHLLSKHNDRSAKA